MKKVAFLCRPGLDSFIKPIVKALETEHVCQLISSHGVGDLEFEAAVEWAEVIWLEWANELTVDMTRIWHKKMEGKQVIVRLHSYEAFAGFAAKINWSVVDDLIFVADHIREIVWEQVPEFQLMSTPANILTKTDGPCRDTKIHTIHNGIDLDKFKFKARSHVRFDRNLSEAKFIRDVVVPVIKQVAEESDQDELMQETGFNIAYIGYLNYKKGPMLLLHAFDALVRADDRYRLHIAGQFQDNRYLLYYEQMINSLGLQNNVHFDGWQDDIQEWLSDKQQIVCTSVLEGCPVGLMEAMACGLRPLVHSFVGASGIFRQMDMWRSIPEFVKAARRPFNEGDSVNTRAFIETNFSFDQQIAKIREVIDG